MFIYSFSIIYRKHCLSDLVLESPSDFSMSYCLLRHYYLVLFTFLCSLHVSVRVCLVLCVVSFSVMSCVQCCVCPPASLGRLHSCITFHLSSLLDRVSAASSFSRAGPGAVPRGQQLIGLRKALYRALRSAFRASRRATCHMLKAYPLPVENNGLNMACFVATGFGY